MARYDMNDAEEYRGRQGIMPAGTLARLKMHIRSGDTQGPEPADGLIANTSKDSDVRYMDCEFTVVSGPNAKRKMWQNLTLMGGKVDKQGVSIGWNITKSMIRAMLESFWGIAPDDMSAEAKAKRGFDGFAELDGLEFAARIDIQKGNLKNPNDPNSDRFDDRNVIGDILTVKDQHYRAVMDGNPPPPAGSAAGSSGHSAAAAPAGGGKPAWQQGNGSGAPAASAPAANAPAAAPAPAPQAQPQQAARKPAWVTGN